MQPNTLHKFVNHGYIKLYMFRTSGANSVITFKYCSGASLNMAKRGPKHTEKKKKYCDPEMCNWLIALYDEIGVHSGHV